jgi:dTDP-4-dehydrorhamnose reductase
VNHLLIVGIDTVVGANVAATLSERYRISTWTPDDRFDVPNCEAVDPADAPGRIVAETRPDWVIYCGPAARSAWEPGTRELLSNEIADEARAWAEAARESGVRMLMVSSDAVFTGPWMFHEEQSPSVCHSPPAQAVRAAERQVQEACPDALILRTHAFGWSADPETPGWIETLLREVETKRFVEQDHIRHATPILATDLAEILERACQEGLSGTYHVAGAERVSPLKFTQRLADQFDLPWLAIRRESVLTELPQGFAEGECSLQTKEIRKALCVAMPLLSEGLGRLQEQAENGYRDRLSSRRLPSRERKVA